MTAMRPLGTRKEDFRQSITSTMTEFRRDLSTSTLRIDGARFLIITAAQDERAAIGAVFQATTAGDSSLRPQANVASPTIWARAWGRGATILAVHPQWSFPDEAWIAADPEFWQSSLVAPKAGVRTRQEFGRTSMTGRAHISAVSVALIVVFSQPVVVQFEFGTPRTSGARDQ